MDISSKKNRWFSLRQTVLPFITGWILSYFFITFFAKYKHPSGIDKPKIDNPKSTLALESRLKRVQSIPSFTFANVPKYPEFCSDHARSSVKEDAALYMDASSAIKASVSKAKQRHLNPAKSPNYDQNAECSTEFARKQLQYFQTYYVHANQNIPLHGPLYCNEDFVVDHFADISPDPGKTFVEIGANKGFDLVKIYSRWTNFTVNTVWKLNHLHPGCPWYADIDRMVFPTVYAFEPQLKTFDALQNLQTYLPLCNLQLFNMAVSGPNSPATMAFTLNNIGDESAHLVISLRDGDKQQVSIVNVTTVNEIVTKHSIPHVHGLFMDTEGSDAEVLRGADHVLDDGKVDFIIFEITMGMKDAQDGVTPLKTVVQFLEAKGYVSFYMGPMDSLVQLSPLQSCWSDDYENPSIRPSNILAVRKNWELSQALVIPFLVGAAA